MSEAPANFEARCEELGLAELLPEMRRRGWNTFSGFGYAVPMNMEKPTQNETFEKDVVGVLLPDQPDFGSSISNR